MSDDTKTGETTTETTEAATATENTGAATGAEGAKPTGDESKPSGELGEKGEETLRKEREARKQAEKELRELRKFKEEAEREKLTEQEKLAADREAAQREAAEAKAALNDLKLESAFTKAATAAGMDPSVVEDVLLAQKASGVISVGEDGEAVGVEEAISALKTAKPIYFGAATATPGNINGGSGGTKQTGPQLDATEAKAVNWFAGAGVTAEDYTKAK